MRLQIDGDLEKKDGKGRKLAPIRRTHSGNVGCEPAIVIGTPYLAILRESPPGCNQKPQVDVTLPCYFQAPFLEAAMTLARIFVVSRSGVDQSSLLVTISQSAAFKNSSSAPYEIQVDHVSVIECHRETWIFAFLFSYQRSRFKSAALLLLTPHLTHAFYT